MDIKTPLTSQEGAAVLDVVTTEKDQQPSPGSPLLFLRQLLSEKWSDRGQASCLIVKCSGWLDCSAPEIFSTRRSITNAA